jgi:hypothetical protein
MAGITGTLHKDQYTFLNISRSVLLIMRNVSDESGRGDATTHFIFINFFFFENHAFCMQKWSNIVKTDRPQMTKRCMHFACCITKATDTHWEYIILIAFPLQQWLHERISKLHYTWYCVSCYIHKMKGTFPHRELILFLFINWYQLNAAF